MFCGNVKLLQVVVDGNLTPSPFFVFSICFLVPQSLACN